MIGNIAIFLLGGGVWGFGAALFGKRSRKQRILLALGGVVGVMGFLLIGDAIRAAI